MEFGKTFKCECGKLLDIDESACVRKEYNDPIYISAHNNIFGVGCNHCGKITPVDTELIALEKREEIEDEKLLPDYLKKLTL